MSEEKEFGNKIEMSSAKEEESKCSYCEMWMAYGSKEDDALMDKISTSVADSRNAKQCHRLLKLLYLGEISIKQFKEAFTKAGMDYNDVEYCEYCAGCVPQPEEDSNGGYHTCPDFNEDEEHECKIRDSVYCNVCGKRGTIGYPITDKNNKEVFTFWTCEKHANDRKLENSLRRGININKLYKFTKLQNK